MVLSTRGRSMVQITGKLLSLFLLFGLLQESCARQNESREIFDAIRNNESAKLQTLIEKGLSFAVVDQNGASPLMWAIYTGNKMMIDRLVTDRFNCDARGIIWINKGKGTYLGSPMAVAAEKKDNQTVELLINKCGTPVDEREYDPTTNNNSGWTALFYAVNNNNYELAKFLVEKGADVNKNEPRGTILMNAAGSGNEQLFDLVLNAGATLNNQDAKFGMNELSYAVIGANKKIVEKLIEKGVKIDVPDNAGKTPLILATEQGNIDLVDLLLAKGASPTLRDKENEDILVKAIKKKDEPMFEKLLQNIDGKDFRYIRNSGLLHLAVFYGNQSAVELLLKHEYDIDAMADEGHTPLLFATLKNHEKVVQLLLRNKASVNIQNKEGLTPLMVTAQLGYFEIMRMLLEFKADPFLKDRNGLNSYDYANSGNNSAAAIEILSSYKKQP